MVKNEVDAAKEAKMRKQAMADSIAIAELTMKMTELESEYEIYKEKCELEIIALRDKNAAYEENRETEDILRAQLLEGKFQCT